jgi:WD40 repeat protein
MYYQGWVDSAQFSSDSRQVVTASAGVVQLWDGVTGKPIREFVKYEAAIYSTQFSPDGQRVVIASQDGTARLWGVRSGKPIGEPMKHGDWVWSARFSPDGRRVVTASSPSSTVSKTELLMLRHLRGDKTALALHFGCHYRPFDRRNR